MAAVKSPFFCCVSPIFRSQRGSFFSATASLRYSSIARSNFFFSTARWAAWSVFSLSIATSRHLSCRERNGPCTSTRRRSRRGTGTVRRDDVGGKRAGAPKNYSFDGGGSRKVRLGRSHLAAHRSSRSLTPRAGTVPLCRSLRERPHDHEEHGGRRTHADDPGHDADRSGRGAVVR